jgi:hypothetical protein
MSEAPLLVCGFFDQPTLLGGLAWRTPGGGGLLAREGEVSEADAEFAEEGGAVELTLESPEASCETELSPLTEPAALKDPAGDDPPGKPRSAICGARVKLSAKGRKRTVDCLGYLTRWESSPIEGAEVMRYLAIPGAERTLLVLTASREPGADGHSGERSCAWLLDAEGRASAFSEALLSTQYDDSGRQTRAGLELWPGEPDAPPMRAAGTLLGEAANGPGLTAALLESSAEGVHGLGGYLIWRS